MVDVSGSRPRRRAAPNRQSGKPGVERFQGYDDGRGWEPVGTRPTRFTLHPTVSRDVSTPAGRKKRLAGQMRASPACNRRAGPHHRWCGAVRCGAGIVRAQDPSDRADLVDPKPQFRPGLQERVSAQRA